MGHASFKVVCFCGCLLPWGRKTMETFTSSITASVSKILGVEDISGAAVEDALKRRGSGADPEMITNEEIRVDDEFLQTYKVTSDAVHGGMGSVWRVRHMNWNVELAMKRPQPRYFAEGSAHKKEVFIRECENWINLGLHPGIVSCYYVREIGGVPSIFSEWMDDGSLKDRIGDGSLYQGTEEEIEERLLRIAIQSADGLKYSHENSLLHQDVKPGNILLTLGCDAKVADFGLAKAHGDDTTVSGYTLQYCPAEQAAGAPAEAWMDVYAWALTVLEMYAGKRLWETGEEAAERCRSLCENCRIPMPDAMKTLITECLEHRPDRAFRDFAGIGSELRSIYRDVTGNEYPVPESAAAPDIADSLNNRALSFLDMGKPAEAEKLWAEALETSNYHLASTYNYSLYQWRKGVIDDTDVIRRCTTAAEGSGAGRSDSSGSPNSSGDDLAASWKQWIDGERGTDSDTVLAPKKMSFDDYFYGLAMSPDARRAYIFVGERMLCVDTSRAECLYDVPTGAKYNYPEISADGKYVFAVDEKRYLIMFDAASGEIVRNKYQRLGRVFSCCAHPDGRHIYTCGIDKKIHKWDYLNCVCERESEPRYVYGKLMISPDGKQVCGHSSDIFTTELATWDADTLMQQFTARNAKAYSMKYSPDGTLIYTVSNEDLCAYKSWNMVRTLQVRETDGQSLWINPEGTRVLVGKSSGEIQVWNRESKVIPERRRNGQIIPQRSDRLNLLFTIPRFGEAESVYQLTAAPDMSLIAYRSVKELCLQNFSQHPVVPAPWELNVAKGYRQILDIDDRANQACNKIAAAIREGDRESALTLLRGAEEEYDARQFWPLYKELARQCRHGKWVSSGIIETLDLPGKGPCLNSIAFSPLTGALAVPLQQKILLAGLDAGDDLGDSVFVEVSGDPRFVLFSHDGRYMVAGVDRGKDGYSVQVFEQTTPEVTGTEAGEQTPPFEQTTPEVVLHAGAEAVAAFNPDDSVLACLSSDGVLKVLETGTFRVKNETVIEHCQEAYDICFTPDGGKIIVSYGWVKMNSIRNDIEMRGTWFEAYDSITLQKEKIKQESIQGMSSTTLMVLPAERKLLKIHSNFYNMIVRSYSLDTWEDLGFYRTPTYCRSHAVLTPEQDILILAGKEIKEKNYYVELWSRPEETLLRRIMIGESSIESIAISPDGTTLAVRTQNGVTLVTMRRELFV